MSALGQKRTKRQLAAMSALPPKADIERHDWHVRLVPLATGGHEMWVVAGRPGTEEPDHRHGRLRVCHVNKDNRDRADCSPNCVERSDGLCPNCVGCELSQFCSERPTGIGVAAEKANPVSLVATQLGAHEVSNLGGIDDADNMVGLVQRTRDAETITPGGFQTGVNPLDLLGNQPIQEMAPPIR